MMIDSPVTEPEELQQDNNKKTPCAYHLDQNQMGEI